ncbi:MAG: hypothetical protein IJ927_03295 [Eubacterium sp.]|jgi:predicted Zn-ribbon and HTH transcriptional regulator|nr:hypothetical protein [Eubacterium sp.]
MAEKCKKCLLLEAGEKVTYNEIMQYVSSLDESELTDVNTAKKRLESCKNCDNLISGMCVKCGCYVEIRARLKNADCPDYDNRKW